MIFRLMLAGLLLWIPVGRDGASEFLAAWPITPPTDDQILEARACDIEGSTLYVDSTLEELDAVENLETACDWAILAQAYVNISGENVTEGARQAIGEILRLNPAMMLSEMLLYGYVGMGKLVEAPPFADHSIVQVDISHEYAGLGSHVAYTASITDADTETPAVTVNVRDAEGAITEEGESTETAETVDPALVQALGASLTDLIPIGSQFSSIVCFDNYPDWTISLTFADGTTLDIKNNESNFFHFGGPFQVEIEGQNYMQYSPAFIISMIDLIQALNLPQGSTAAMSCTGFDPPLLEAAFPDAAERG